MPPPLPRRRTAERLEEVDPPTPEGPGPLRVAIDLLRAVMWCGLAAWAAYVIVTSMPTGHVVAGVDSMGVVVPALLRVIAPYVFCRAIDKAALAVHGR